VGEVVEGDCDCARAEPAATSTVAGMAITVANRTVEIILMMEMCVAGGVRERRRGSTFGQRD
jgi:hypothetical protein